VEVERSTTWVFHAGQPVHDLIAPDGSVYAMRSASLIKDPSLTEQLPNLGERLQMPDAWTYRVRTPDHDLVVQARDGVLMSSWTSLRTTTSERTKACADGW